MFKLFTSDPLDPRNDPDELTRPTTFTAYVHNASSSWAPPLAVPADSNASPKLKSIIPVPPGINPPVRLYSSISLLDRMLENIPGGVDNFPRFYSRLVDEIGRVYKRADRVDFGEDFLYKAFNAVDPDNEELAALIGVSFRISSANMAFTSDLMTDFGYMRAYCKFITKARF